jgi:quercetin dioxygenase-like cupin family protein
MSPYSRRQAIVVLAGFAASAALDAYAKDSNMQRNAVMDIDIKRNGSRPSTKGNSDWFTGSVRVDPLFHAPDPGRVSGGQVTFEPGARTAWHTHPLGQTLLVTAGLGRAQREDGSIEEIRPGDIVWFEPGEKHWHGASPDCAMTHIAIAEMKDGSAVAWMEKVTDAQYAKGEK